LPPPALQSTFAGGRFARGVTLRSPMRSRKAAAVAFCSLLLLAVAPGRAAEIDWAHAETLSIAMVDYRFEPDRLVLRRGVAYRLRFVNRSRFEWHEFTAPKFLRSVVVGNPKALNAKRSELSVPPGSVRKLYLVPRAPGEYRFWCSDHDWAGMEGTITVK
jgi:plastocyanin